MDTRPWKIGIVGHSNAFPKEVVQKHELRLSAAAHLSDLRPDYVFYTPALMYLRIRLMGREPFCDFLNEYNKPVVPLTVRFSRPIFRGLNLDADEEWNHVLYAIEQEHWEAYTGWMGTLAFADRDKGLITRIRNQELHIADPLYFERAVILPDSCPVVPITAFCLDTNKGSHYFETGIHPFLELPKAVFNPNVNIDTAVFGRAILRESENPYRDVNKLGDQPGLKLEEREIIDRVTQARKELP